MAFVYLTCYPLHFTEEETGSEELGNVLKVTAGKWRRFLAQSDWQLDSDFSCLEISPRGTAVYIFVFSGTIHVSLGPAK